jgi:hypothetical protein
VEEPKDSGVVVRAHLEAVHGYVGAVCMDSVVHLLDAVFKFEGK